MPRGGGKRDSPPVLRRESTSRRHSSWSPFFSDSGGGKRLSSLTINSGSESTDSRTNVESVDFSLSLSLSLSLSPHDAVASANSRRIRRSNDLAVSSLWTSQPRGSWRRFIARSDFHVLCMADVYDAAGKLKFDRDNVYSIFQRTLCQSACERV